MTETYEDYLKKDFRNFLFVVWQFLGLPPPTAVQYEIAYYLQHGPRRRIIQAFRGAGKSWITAAYVLWLLFCDPERRILVVSASKDRSDAFSVFVKRLIDTMPLLQHLKPREGQRDSNLSFDVGTSSPHQAPSVRSVGITGQLTGGRATHIIADDVEVPKNSLTQTMRDRLSESVKEFDAVLSPGGDIIYLGTPQCEMSLYNVLPSRGYDVRVWPARMPDLKFRERLGTRLAPALLNSTAEVGTPVEPTRFGEDELREREASYGRSGFALQFQLNTAIADGDRYPLKLADLIVMALDHRMAPINLTWGAGRDQIINDIQSVGLAGDHLHAPMFYAKDAVPYQGVVMAIDPAGRGGDELSYAVVAMLNGWLYLLDCRGLTGGYRDENLQTLADVAKKLAVKQIIVEENFGDGMFSKLLTPFLARTHPVSMEELKHSTQKEKRIIDTLEPIMNQHRLVVDTALLKLDAENYNGYAEDIAHRYQLFYQMTRITNARGCLAKDDRVDVLAMAVQYWVEQMDKDTQKVEAERKAELLDQELARFADHVLGHTPKSPTWASI